MKLTATQKEYVSALERRAQRKKLSINKLCQRAKVSRSTFTRWKNGKSAPTMRLMSRVEKALENTAR